MCEWDGQSVVLRGKVVGSWLQATERRAASRCGLWRVSLSVSRLQLDCDWVEQGSVVSQPPQATGQNTMRLTPRTEEHPFR